MDRKTLLAFAEKILSGSSEKKAMISLRQLQQILEEQGAPASERELLGKMLGGMPEMLEAPKNHVLTEEDIEIACRRATERRIREEAARYRGRC